MRGLRICLLVAGILCLLSVFGVLLPLSAWQSFVQLFGFESLPDSPLFEYAARLMSATYAAVGIFFIILARRPGDYGIMVTFAGWSAVALGVICAVVGFTVEMPNLWFLGDSASCLVLGVLILVFWQQAKKSGKEKTV